MSLKDKVAVEGPSPVGRVFAKAGEKDLDADLYEIGFMGRPSRRVTEEARVSTVGGCKDRLVVAAAQREHGYVDTLQQISGDKLGPVPGLGTPHASDPHLSGDCKLLYQELAGTEPDLVQEVRVATDAAEPSVVFSDKSEAVGGATWGPNGQILVIRRLAAGAKLILIGADGKQREVDPGAPDVGNPQWSSTGWIALTVLHPDGPPSGGVFLNPDTGERAQIEGWLPLAWSPDGTQLLLRDTAKGTILAVAELSNLAVTRNVGLSEVGTVWDAVWLPSV